jgi:Ca2+-binding RTX toxin-like protein
MSMLFSDDFNTPGPDVNRAIWTTPTGDAAFFGRTAIRNPGSTINGSGRIAVFDGVAHLLLSTHNPTAWKAGDSFWGSEIDSIESFGFGNGAVGLEFAARVRSPEPKPPGLVTSLFGYQLLPGTPLLHDEIDWEFLSNHYQPAIDPPRALTNRYAAEPTGPGHHVELAFPSGFDFTDFHVYAIRYYQAFGGSDEGRIEWLVDGVLMHVEESNVPTGDLSVNLNIWAPAADFPLAYSPALQPTPNPSDNVDYDYQIDWVSVASTTTPFFDDHDFAAQAKLLPGVIEPAVPIYYNGTLVGGHNHHAVELFDKTPNASGFPSTFVDLVANTYVRDTYQRPDGSSGHYGTSFAATFSYRTAGGNLVYLPSVDRGDISIGGNAKYTAVVSGHFGSVANTTSTRTFSDPTFDFTRVGVSIVLDVQQDVALATGSARFAGDVLRAGTLASMFSTPQQFDASLLLWEDADGDVHSLQLDDTTARDAHLFGTAQEFGTWIELVKGAGSSWYPDSPTVRLVINNPHGLRLGVQGFLASTLNPNDDSLSVWPELLDPPSSLVPGASYAVDLEVVAVAPLTDNTTYVTPFSAKLQGTPFTNASLSGTANINAMGNDGDNVLEGNSGKNRLDGGAGNDTMIGGDGNDTYYVRDGGDVVSETNANTSTGGTDLVYSTLASYTLGANVENGRIGTSAAANLSGNNLNNFVYAGAGNNVIDGGAGTDTLSYAYATAGVTVSLATPAAQATGGSATDTVRNFENLTGSGFNDKLTGNTSANTLTGGLGNDTLNGGTGADTMIGGDGSDLYDVDHAGDVVSETNASTSTGGTDLVYSTLASYTLGANVENGRIVTSAAANLNGNGLNNVLYAGAGNNVLDGGAGTDTLSYAYATAGVTVSLATPAAQATGGSATDTVRNFENLTGSSFNDKLTGDTNANTLTGGLGNDTLDGGTGADTMIGGDGSDRYYVHHAGDVVSETNAASTGGTDLVYSTLASYTLGANVENGRILATGAANLTGNTLNNLLYAGAGNNSLTGGDGTDTVSYAYGLSGTTGVTVSLALATAQVTGGSGTDTLISIENLTGSNYNDRLTGNTGANSLNGGTGNDILNGGAGADSMTGGDGSDIYYVDNAGDVVSETNAVAATGGTDLVYSTLSTYTLGANVENGRILATGTASLTGNTLNNLLYAGAGNNTLNGSSGTDTASYAYGLSGTTGVTVSLALTTAQATGGSGSDTLVSIENLTGSNYNDRLTGTTGANRLNGGSGNDTLTGGAGKDQLTGGSGNDTFDFNALAEMGTSSATWDIISDFVRGQDKIDLTTLDANTAVAGNQAFTAPVVGGTFSGAFAINTPATLYFDSVADVLYGNTDADAAAEFALQLTGLSTLAASDLFL